MKVTIKSITTKDIVSYIAEFARVCTHRDQKETLIERDLEFCKTLWKNGHHTPFESINVDFLIEDVSRSLLAQITRYRHATFSVESQRYCKYDDNIDFIIPRTIAENDIAILDFDNAASVSIREYNNLIANGVKPEDARCVLPNATPTRFRVVMNLREFFHFYKQRSDPHSQQEIRELSQMMYKQLLDSVDLKSEELILFIRHSFNHDIKALIKTLQENAPKSQAEWMADILKEFSQYI